MNGRSSSGASVSESGISTPRNTPCESIRRCPLMSRAGAAPLVLARSRNGETVSGCGLRASLDGMTVGASYGRIGNGAAIRYRVGICRIGRCREMCARTTASAATRHSPSHSPAIEARRNGRRKEKRRSTRATTRRAQSPCVPAAHESTWHHPRYAARPSRSAATHMP